MSEGKRPGGLTALAVINFVFGAGNAIVTLGMAAMLALIQGVANEVEGSENPDANAVVDAWRDLGMGLFYFMLLMYAVAAILLIASGVGYLQQKKFLGRTLGTGYAVLAIVSLVVSAMMVSADAGGGFTIGTMVFLIYPVLTLLLLNTTFKHDFTR
ncbi:MAG: hypothetical protein ACI89X_000123 [Planctomycetota bacterium]|jgi:hypothetical protein